MTDNDVAGSTPPDEEPALSRQQEPGTSQSAGDPGYLTKTGEAVGEDGSVAPIIGGLPAVEGSAWDIGAPLDERGEDTASPQRLPGWYVRQFLPGTARLAISYPGMPLLAGGRPAARDFGAWVLRRTAVIC